MSANVCSRWRSNLDRHLAATALGVILLLTLWPSPSQAYASSLSPFWCIVCGATGGVDVVLNVLLFVPLGLGLAWMGLRPWKALLVGVGVSLLIELLQLTVVAGRDGSLSDLLTNTLGTLVGAWLFGGWRQLVRPSPRASRRAAVAGTVAWLASLGAVVALYTPAAPAGQLSVAWAPRYPGAAAWFEGRVLGAAAADLALPPGPLAGAEELRTLLKAGAPVSVRLVAGPPTIAGAPVLEVLDHRQFDAVGLAQRERSLIYTAPSRSSALRLRHPWVALHEVFPALPGETLTVRGSLDRGRLIVSAESGDRVALRTIALSPDLGWTLVMPARLGFGGERRATTVLWVAAQLLALGYLGSRGFAGRREAAAILGLGAAIALGLGALPALADWPPVHWSEWVAAAGGMAAGWLLGVLRPAVEADRAAPARAAAG